MRVPFLHFGYQYSANPDDPNDPVLEFSDQQIHTLSDSVLSVRSDKKSAREASDNSEDSMVYRLNFIYARDMPNCWKSREPGRLEKVTTDIVSGRTMLSEGNNTGFITGLQTRLKQVLTRAALASGVSDLECLKDHPEYNKIIQYDQRVIDDTGEINIRNPYVLCVESIENKTGDVYSLWITGNDFMVND